MSVLSLLRTLVFSTSIVSALPAPAASQYPPNPTGPPGASGPLRGPESLAGEQAGLVVPTQPSIVTPPSDFELADGQSADSDLGFYLNLDNVKNPQPIRGGTTAPTDPGPRNYEYDKLNSDLFAPPGTDTGGIMNAKWPLGLSHNRHGLNSAGWARQQNVDVMPVATAMAGVDMHLEPYAYREMHWHQQGEWAYILNGTARIGLVNEGGQTFVDDVTQGDVWFFPPGVPHSIQALGNGVEFLLVFNSGDFSEDNTFLLSELFERNPKAVLAKDLRTDTSAFEKLPNGQLYIFNGTTAPANKSEQHLIGPAGVVPQDQSFSYHWSQVQPYEVPGGSIKILDPISFPTASTFSVALVTVHPGAMRELHWHTRSDEWSYFLAGQARLTVFEAPESSQTFDFAAGDVGYVPVADAHYIENTGDTDVVFLEILQQDQFTDISVGQWLGLTAPQIVKDHLNLPDDTIANLPKTHPWIVPGNGKANATETNFTGGAL